MLKQIRSSVAGWAVKVLMGVLIASFAMWGVTDFLRVSPDSSVAEIGNREITVSQFQANFQRQVQSLQQRFGSSFTAEQARQFGLVEQTLQQMVATALFDHAAEDLELTASDAEVVATIRAKPEFQGAVGGFDRFRYDNLLRSNGYSEQAYVDITRRQMARQQLFDSLIGGLKAPNNITEAYYKFQAEKRKIETLTIPHAEMTEIVAPNDSDFAAYHSEHSAEFMAPEYRRIAYVTLQPEDLLDDMTISEDELKADFESRRSEFSSEETRAVEQLLVGDKEKAENTAALIASGADFYQIAEKTAALKPEDVKLGKLRISGLPLEVRDTVFALPLNKISDPLEGPFGWVIYRVTEITPASEQTFADVRSRVERELKLQRASDAIYDLSTRLDDSLAGGASLEETAQIAELPVMVLNAVDRTGLDKSGLKIASLPAVPTFLNTVFSTELMIEPTLHETDNGGYFMLRVDEIIDPALRPVADVKDDIVKMLESERRAAAAANLAEELKSKAAAGMTFAGLAGDEGWLVKTSALETRASMTQKAGVDAAMVNALFQADASNIITGTDNQGNGQVIARVIEIVTAKPGEEKAKVELIGTQVATSMSNDLINQYRIALEAEYSVKIDQAAINAIFAQPQQ